VDEVVVSAPQHERAERCRVVVLRAIVGVRQEVMQQQLPAADPDDRPAVHDRTRGRTDDLGSERADLARWFAGVVAHVSPPFALLFGRGRDALAGFGPTSARRGRACVRDCAAGLTPSTLALEGTGTRPDC